MKSFSALLLLFLFIQGAHAEWRVETIVNPMNDYKTKIAYILSTEYRERHQTAMGVTCYYPVDWEMNIVSIIFYFSDFNSDIRNADLSIPWCNMRCQCYPYLAK